MVDLVLKDAGHVALNFVTYLLAPLVEALEGRLLDLRSGRGAEVAAAFRRTILDSAAEPS